MAHVCKHEEDIKELRATDKGHVSWVLFWSITILLCSIFGTITNANYARLVALEKSNNETNIASARIETQLSQIQLGLAEIKVALKEQEQRINK